MAKSIGNGMRIFDESEVVPGMTDKKKEKYNNGIICGFCTNWGNEIDACRVARTDHESPGEDIRFETVKNNHRCPHFTFDIKKQHSQVVFENLIANLNKYIQKLEQVISINHLKLPETVDFF